MPEQEYILLRESNFNNMCEIQQQLYKRCVVPDDFNEYADIPETLLKILLYKVCGSIEKNLVKQISEIYTLN